MLVVVVLSVWVVSLATTKKRHLTFTGINVCSVFAAFALKVPLGNGNLG